MNLPKVYQNRNVGNVNNDQEFFYSANPSKAKLNVKNTNLDSKINNLFKSNKYIYKINVNIKTSTRDFDTVVIGKTNNNLITLDNDLIPIKDIIDINEK
ncbi:MAG: hypothetical protein OSJ65_07605 [Bacilli bacterium]|nr:hypothetical protein [Bacilli bacterium]